MSSQIDLHLHTTASDGLLTPEQLVDLALARGMRLIAITDHDSTDGIEPAIIRAVGQQLEIWPGVEISTDVPHTEVHILGYFVDHHNADLQAVLTKLRLSRTVRAQQMVQKLGELGMRIAWERVLELAGTGAVGRPHVAQALAEAGYVSTPREAFTLYIGREGPAYVERYKQTPPEAVRLILQMGGLPSLAHPTYIASPTETGIKSSLRGVMPELVGAGLAGIEAFYPDYSTETTRELIAIAAEFDLIPTGGSDFHGRADQQIEMGQVDIPEETIEAMRAWRARFLSHRDRG